MVTDIVEFTALGFTYSADEIVCDYIIFMYIYKIVLQEQVIIYILYFVHF